MNSLRKMGEFNFAETTYGGNPEWDVLEATRQQYYGLSVGKTFDEETNKPCTFDQETWDFSESHKSWLKTKFSTIFPNSKQPLALELLARMVGYNLSVGHSIKEYSAKTISGTLTDAKDLFDWLIKNNILSAVPGTYLITPSRLTSDDFNSFFDEIGKFSLTGFLGKVRFISVWYELSLAKRLPSLLSLTTDPFSGVSAKKTWEARSEMREERSEEETSWDPIPLNFAFRMINEALKLVIDRREAVLAAYEICKQTEALDTCRNTGLKKLLRLHPELKDTLPPHCIRGNRVYFAPLLSFIDDAKDSAIIIILVTTGLRNWELRDLKKGCCTPDLFIQNAYRLQARIKKTSRERSQGKLVNLPIPAPTALAIELLEQLKFNNTEFLIETTKKHSKNQKKRTCTHFIDNRVKAFCSNKEIGYIPHPHQFRKTIAGWFGIHSRFATLLVMRLFSHESAEMANRYLFNNPLIKAERQKKVLEAFNSIIGPLKTAILDDKIAGPKAKKLKESVNEHAHFEGLTGDELAQSLEQLMRERIESDDMCLLLTPFAVCTSLTNSDEKLPCAVASCSSTQCSLDSKIMKFNEHTPNPAKCIGAGCSRAIVTSANKTAISDELAFYRSVLENSGTEFNDNVYLMKKAVKFIKDHEEIEEEL